MNRANRAKWRKVRARLGEVMEAGIEVERSLMDLLDGDHPDRKRIAGKALAAAMAGSDELLAALMTFDTLLPDAVAPKTARANDSRLPAAHELAAKAREMRERGVTVTTIAKAIDRTPRTVSRMTERRNVRDETT